MSRPGVLEIKIKGRLNSGVFLVYTTRYEDHPGQNSQLTSSIRVTLNQWERPWMWCIER